jgi:two-component sensor histidine kinase
MEPSTHENLERSWGDPVRLPKPPWSEVQMADRAQLLARQKALADFGEFALRSDDLDEVLHEACRIVADTLATELAKVLEIEPGSQELLVRAGVGWRPSIVGRQRIPLGVRSSEAYSIKIAAPVITRDIRHEPRFDVPPFMREHGAIALVNVPIFLPGGKPYGLLQVDSCKPRDFGEDDIEFLRTYATVLGPVIDRLHKIHSLEQALQANQQLLRELQHRVKNHLSIITSLVQLRARQVQSEDVRKELKAVGERIETLRLLNDLLHQSGSVDRLSLRPFIVQLVENLCRLHRGQSGDVRLDFAIDELDMSPEKAVPVGLILNEFVTNSLKYAFDGEGGTIAVAVEALAGDALRLKVRDNGKGMPAAEAMKPGSGTGIKLIEGLARQIGAEAVWSSAEPGAALCLEFAAR